MIPAKAAIAERIKKSIADSDGTFPDFKKRIEALGVQVECNTAKTTNHISGISFKFGGIAMKGSKVARAYVADPLLATAKAARFSRANAGKDCELDQGGGPEIAIS